MTSCVLSSSFQLLCGYKEIVSWALVVSFFFFLFLIKLILFHSVNFFKFFLVYFFYVKGTLLYRL